MAGFTPAEPPPVVMPDEPRRSRRAVVALASGLCLVGAACAVAASAGLGGAAAPRELFGPWDPATVHVASPQPSMRATLSMHSMWQQAKWARLFQKPARKAPQQMLAERSFDDAVGFHTALAAAAQRAAPVRYPSEVASERASELEHNAPHYVRALQLAAASAPARTQQLEEVPKARTQSLDYMESKPRSDTRHPGDLDVYQTYEYYPRPEGRGVTDYDGHRLWDEMQRDYRAQHPSASTYPAVPVVFKEDSEGGHPIANPLSQPVEDIYQGMGYEDNMVPPYGMGSSAGGASEAQAAGTMKLSPKEGFEMMKRADERRAHDAGGRGSGYSYRNPDWHAHYVPRRNADDGKTFFATPSVAKPVYYDSSAHAGHRSQGEGEREAPERGGRDERDARGERELEAERRDLADRQKQILQEQKKLDHELQQTREERMKQQEHAAHTAAPSPAQALYRWERAHGVDDPNAYAGVTGGDVEERRAQSHAEAKAAKEAELRSDQQRQLRETEQQLRQLRSSQMASPADRFPAVCLSVCLSVCLHAWMHGWMYVYTHTHTCIQASPPPPAHATRLTR